MMTSVLDASAGGARVESIRAAVCVLREGGLVAFPTETVYGLGAAASNDLAVRGIFEAKGRPSGVPLIVHVTDIALASRYVNELPRAAYVLAERHWPGPLTFVLPRAEAVSRSVAGGGATVAVRAPAHDVARALITELGEGIAAPSANRYNDLPPVRAQHVMRGLGGAIDCVLDAGRCPGGLESTVLDLTTQPARVLRRGAVSIDSLREAIEVEDVGQGSPAPQTFEGAWLSVVERDRLVLAASVAGHVGVLTRACDGLMQGEPRTVVRCMPPDAAGYAAELYDALHELRDAGCERVLVEALPAAIGWDAMRDRLVRLAESMKPA